MRSHHDQRRRARRVRNHRRCSDCHGTRWLVYGVCSMKRALDYWFGRKKWQYEGKIRRGDVLAFIRRKT